MITVVVADDQPLVRMGIDVLLGEEPDLELVAQAADGPEALAAVRRTRPDVALLDIRMPGLDGLEVLARIGADPDLAATRVVMLTTFGLDEYVFAALRAGASGFLLKDGEAGELLRAIRTVAAGDALLSPAITARVVERFAGTAPLAPAHPGVADLTAREREIVTHVAQGLSNDEIAGRLVVSPATVRTHVQRAMSKLGARDRAQLVVFAYQNRLAPPV
ncbi:transcriptional regulator [Jatrophihabitans fulvus]